MLFLFIVMLLLLGECLARVFESRSYSRHLAKSNKVVKTVKLKTSKLVELWLKEKQLVVDNIEHHSSC